MEYFVRMPSYQALYKLLIKILIAVKSAATNIGIHASLSVMIFSGSMPHSGLVGSYTSSSPSFFKESAHCSL